MRVSSISTALYTSKTAQTAFGNDSAPMEKWVPPAVQYQIQISDVFEYENGDKVLKLFENYLEENVRMKASDRNCVSLRQAYDKFELPPSQKNKKGECVVMELEHNLLVYALTGKPIPPLSQEETTDIVSDYIDKRDPPLKIFKQLLDMFQSLCPANKLPYKIKNKDGIFDEYFPPSPHQQQRFWGNSGQIKLPEPPQVDRFSAILPAFEKPFNMDDMMDVIESCAEEDISRAEKIQQELKEEQEIREKQRWLF